MDLKSLRAYVANVLDYNPDNETYKVQIDQLLNDAYDMLVNAEPWPWAQQEEVVTVRPDVPVTVTFTNGLASFTVPAGGLDDSMDGHYIEIPGAPQPIRIGWIESATVGWLTGVFDGATVTVAGNVVYRYLHLPTTAQETMQVLMRDTNNNASPSPVGVMVPLLRGQDEMLNLSFGTVGTPQTWVPADPDFIPTPRGVTGVALTPSIGQGARTVDIAMTYLWGGRESGLSPYKTYTLTATDLVTLTPPANPGATPFYRRYYVRCPGLGLNGWYRLRDVLTKQSDVSPLGGVTLTPALSQATLEGEAFALLEPRYKSSPAGIGRRIRPYPRQAVKTEITVRSITRPRRLEEDFDTSIVPVENRVVLAQMALEKACLKHDQAALSQVYASKANDIIRKMAATYLIEKSSRIIKGGWNDGLNRWYDRNGPLTFTP